MTQASTTYLVADLFCGAGGSSTGAERAITQMGGRMELVAVNHWPVAVETHQLNHPTARHYVQNLDTIDPETLVPEGRLDLLMASPECRFYSRARGGKPIHDQGRMNPWAVQRWLTAINVRCVLVENVPEFKRWGPLDENGKPIKKRAGEYFEAWLRALIGLGYEVEWRIINAADYGEATSRKRFFLQARNDGQPIAWPEPTHSKNGEPGLFGALPKWRGAQEIIDWSNTGKSLLDDPKYQRNPLALNTRRRIARGLQKFGGPLAPLYIRLLDLPPEEEAQYGCNLEPGRPFIINRNGENGSDRIHDINHPCPTALGRGAGYLVTTDEQPMGEIWLIGANRAHNTPHDGQTPAPTITTAPGGGLYLVEAESLPFMLGQQSGSVARLTDQPTPTIVASGGKISLVKPTINPIVVEYYTNSYAKEIAAPIAGITANGGKHALVQGTLADPESEASQELASAVIVVVNHGNGADKQNGDDRRVKPLGQPLNVITTVHGIGLAQPILVQTSQTGGNGDYCRTTEEPTSTITTKNDLTLAIPTAEPFVVPNFGERDGQDPRVHNVSRPAPTITGRGAGNLTVPIIEPAAAEEMIKDGINPKRIILIDGHPCLLDIRFRMLENTELARAMGFDDEETKYEFVGKKAEITKQIGNAVPVKVAAALVASILDTPNARAQLNGTPPQNPAPPAPPAKPTRAKRTQRRREPALAA